WLQGVEEPNPLKGLGLSLYSPAIDTLAAAVTPGSPADVAGMKAGDRVVSVDDQVLDSGQEWVDYVKQRAGQSMNVLIERKGEQIRLSMTPTAVTENDETFGRVGMALQ